MLKEGEKNKPDAQVPAAHSKSKSSPEQQSSAGRQKPRTRGLSQQYFCQARPGDEAAATEEGDAT